MVRRIPRVCLATLTILSCAAAAAADTGSITGTVTDASNGNPISGVSVAIVDANGAAIATATTDPSGVYTIASLNGGIYYAKTSNTLGYVDQIYSGIVCLTCATGFNGTAITVTPPAATSHVDFALTAGGRISGTIKDQSAAALVGITAQIYDAFGRLVTTGVSDGSGAYTSATGLTTGTYFVRSSNVSSDVDALYDGISCSNCPVVSGTPVTVTTGSATTDINLVLQATGSISGHVQAAENSAALASATVNVYGPDGFSHAFGQTDGSGNYTIAGVPPGTYYVDAVLTGRVRTLYNGLPCLGCTVTLGAPVTVTPATVTPGINFSLALGASIAGTVTDGTSHAAIQNVIILALNVGFGVITEAFTAADGTYTLNGLPPSSYFITATSFTGTYANQLYASPANITCGLDCPVPLGTPVTVSGTATVSGIDFALPPVAQGGGGPPPPPPPRPGRIKGAVTNGTTPVANVTVQAFLSGSPGFPAGSAITASDGTYTVSSLTPGQYVVKTSNTQGYLDQVYNGHTCVNCTPASGDLVTVVSATDTPNINFTLAPGARISGHVRDTASNPIPGLSLLIQTQDGGLAGSATTGPDGRYQSSVLVAGAYVVKTNSGGPYVDKMYNDITCPLCFPLLATVVPVTSGSTATNIDFTLSLGGAVSGTVTDTGGQPLAGVTVVTGSKSTTTNALGRYVIQGVAPGLYTLSTVNTLGYVNQSSPNVVVVQGSTTTGIDFHLSAGGSVSGTVTTSDGAPIPNVVVIVFTGSGITAGAASTSSNGSYVVTGLASGTYFVATRNSLGFVDHVHATPADLVCMLCQAFQVGAGVAVAQNQTATVNFVLPLGGAISGTVTDSSSAAPIANVFVTAAPPAASGGLPAVTSSAGVYTITGLAPGSYAVTTSINGYAPQLYNGRACDSCNTSTGDLVAVTAGAIHGGINFALVSIPAVVGASLSGTVVDTSGVPIEGALVELAGNSTGGSASTDNLGRYTVSGIPDGIYTADASDIGYAPATGGQVTVHGGTATPGSVNFTLTRGGRISGTLTDSTTGVPVVGVVFVYDSNGFQAGETSTDAGGTYRVGGLSTGTYYVRALAGSAHLPTFYGGATCLLCAVTIGKPVTVTAGAETSGINMALPIGGTISGTITDAATGLPVAGTEVGILDAHDNFVSVGFTDGLGHYTTAFGLSTGTYYVIAGATNGYVTEVFDGFLCIYPCNESTGTPVIVTAGHTTANINFSLSLGGRITGRVTSGGAGIANVFVAVFDSSNQFVTQTTSGQDGSYGITSVPAGTYFLATYNTAGLADQVYSGLPCSELCVFTSGTPVTVAAGGTTAGINFDLPAAGRISGRVTDSATGAGIYAVEVDVYNAAGVWVGFETTDRSGVYVTDEGLAPGTYYVQTTNKSGFGPAGYRPQLFNGMPCSPCSPTSGTPVTVAAGSTTGNVNFVLGAGSPIRGTVTDSVTGLPISNVEVDVYDGQGRKVTVAVTADNGRYSTFDDLPSGTYFVRTLSNSGVFNALTGSFDNSGYVDQLYNTGVCLACDVTHGTPVTPDGFTPVTGIDFALSPGGQLAGTVTASAGGTPIRSVTVRFYNSAGALIGDTQTNAAGAYTSPGLPPGNYFVRTFNSSGFIDQLYTGVACTPCATLQGTRVTVVNAGVKTGIDFALDQGGMVAGWVRDQSTGLPIVGASVSIFDHTTHTLVAVTAKTDTSGAFSISLPPGVYDLQTNPIDGFKGAFAQTTVAVTPGSDTSGIGIDLAECTPVSVGPASLPLATAGQAYSATFTASGGTAPYAFSVIDGAINTGLSLSSSGVVSGTPAFAGAASFTVGAADSTGCGGTAAVTLTACSFFLSTGSMSSIWTAGNGSVDFTASTPNCTWTAVSNAPWITITSAAAGSGNGSVSFTFAANVGGAPRTGTITVGGQVFAVTQASVVPRPPFGVLELPADGATGLAGAIPVTGWALDDLEVSLVTICRDPVTGEAPVPVGVCGGQAKVYIGNAVFVDGARPDVAAAFPGTPFNTRAGFGYLLLSNMMPNQGNGTFTLHAYAINAVGSVTTLGDRTVTFNNAAATKPFGSIDTPAQGESISGTAYINFGWAVTPQPKTIPTDGSTMAVFVDGLQQGGVDYNHFRPDIATLFPGLANSNGAVGFHVFDTTTLTNGTHSIFWIVTDDGGITEGIGSRYFTVNNTLASLRAQPPAAVFAPGFAPDLKTRPPSVGDSLVGRVFRPGEVDVQYGVSVGGTLLLDLPPDSNGLRAVSMGQLDRLTLKLNNACGGVAGREVTDGGPQPLPTGSTLDPSGTFYWHPGPAFLGTYHLEFTVPVCGAGTVTVPVDVTIVDRR